MDIRFILPNEIEQAPRGIITDIEGLRLPADCIRILKGMEDFIKQRYTLFEQEIEQEEKGESYTLIDMSIPELKFIGYSATVTKKMKETVTEQDFSYLTAKFQQ